MCAVGCPFYGGTAFGESAPILRLVDLRYFGDGRSGLGKILYFFQISFRPCARHRFAILLLCFSNFQRISSFSR